jgi:enamine deaminase RidA (YjgF/YER057c/UK114 family)
MSQAVVHGSVAYLAGQVAKGENVTAQTEAVLGQIDALLTTAGTDKTKLLTATIYLADMATFGEMNAVWDKWVSAGNTPARATVEAALATPEYKVEIVVTAAI